MDGTDADGEWSDEEAVRSGSNTGVSETEADDHQMVTIKRPQPGIVVSSLSNIRLMTSADPLSADDPVNSILDKIDAEIEAMDMDHPTDSQKMTSSKPSRPGSNGRSKSNHSHSRHPLCTTQVPSLNLSKSIEQEDTDTGLGSASFRGDEGSNADRINGTAEIYSEAALTDALTDEDNTPKAPDDVPSDLDSLVAQQIDYRFKEIMRKKKDDSDSDQNNEHQVTSMGEPKRSNSKVKFTLPKDESRKSTEKLPPDLPMHPGKPLASGSLSTRLRSRNAVRPSATMLSTGYGTDNESVKTEDFEAKFMNMLVTSDNERPANETTLEKRPIKCQKILPERRNGELETPVVSETLPSPQKKDALGNQSGDDDDMIQRLRSIANGKPAPKTSAISLTRPRSLSPTRLRLHRYRTSDNLRGIWDSSSSIGFAKGSSQVFSWDDEFWKQRSQNSVTSTSNSTFEEVESLCLSKSSNDSHFGGLTRPWDRPWGRNAATKAVNGRGGTKKFVSRQSSTTSTSTSLSSGPLGELQSSDSCSSRHSVGRGSILSLLETMELLSRQGGLDPTERLYLDKIFQRVMDYKNSKSPMGSSRESPIKKGLKDSAPSQPSDLVRFRITSQDANDVEDRSSKQKSHFSDVRRKVLGGKTRRRRDLIIPEEDDKSHGYGSLNKKSTNYSKLDHDVKSPTGSNFTTDSSLNSGKFFTSVSSNREDFPPKEVKNNDVTRPGLAMFMSRNSLNKGGGSFDSTASPTDPFNSFTAPYSASHAERVLMGLGFGSTEGFLPERFLRDWYTKVSMAHELEAREQGEIYPESSEKIPKDTSSPKAHPNKPCAPVRYDSHLSFASSSLDEAMNLPPVNNGSDSKNQRLQEYLANFSTDYGLNDVDFNTKIKHFANSRQKSLPLYLETLSEEEDSRSRVPGVDPFDKEHKLRKFICDEMSNSGRSTVSNSEQSVLSSSQSENDSLSGCSDSRHRSNSRIAAKTSKPYSRPVEQKHLKKENRESQETKLLLEQKKTDSIQRLHNIDQQNKLHSNSKNTDIENEKVTVDDKIEGAVINMEGVTSKPQPQSSALSRSGIHFSNDSLEVADIMKNNVSESGDTKGSNISNKTKPAVKMVEPAMVSIVLEDVDEGMDSSVGSKACVKSDSSHLSIPLSAQALSPIPQSPVTVIEVGLDNQQDSLDTEEGTGSSREVDEETVSSHQCESCGRYSPEPNPASHRRRSRPRHQDTVRRMGFPVDAILNSTNAEDTGSNVSSEVPFEKLTNKEGPNSEAERFISSNPTPGCNKDKTGKCYDESPKNALHPRLNSSRSDSSSGSKSPTAIKRKNLKRQKARQGKNNLPFEEAAYGERDEALIEADHLSPSKLKVSPSYKSQLSSRSHIDLTVACSCHGCHHHSPDQSDHYCHHHHHRHSAHISHDTSCQYFHNSFKMAGSPRKCGIPLSRNHDNYQNFLDSAFRTTKNRTVIRSPQAVENDLETSETDPNEFPSIIDTSLEPRSIISVRKGFKLIDNGHLHNPFNSSCTAQKPSPVTFSSSMPVSPKHRKYGDGRVQSISRAVQANLSHNCSLSNSLQQSLLNSEEYFLARDQEVQCSFSSFPFIGSTHFHKYAQTLNSQYEVSCQTHESFNTSLKESTPTESEKSREMSNSKAINTVLCLIGNEHDNFPWHMELEQEAEFASLWSKSHFRLVDETLNQIEQELTAINDKHSQNDPKNIEDGALLDVSEKIVSEPRQVLEILEKTGPLSESAEIRANLNVSEMSISEKAMRKDERNEVSFSCQSPNPYNVDLQDRLQECIKKMDIQKEMKDYLSPCLGMYSNDTKDIACKNEEINLQNCQAPAMQADSEDSLSSSKMPSNIDPSHSQGGDLSRCHNKLSRLKYAHNSHQNSCTSLDIETDFMNAGDPLGSLDGSLLIMNSPDPDTSYGDESPINASCPVKSGHGSQSFQACHLPSYPPVTEVSSSDNLLTDNEEVQVSTHRMCFASSEKQDENKQATSQRHDKLRRLVPLAKKRAVLQANNSVSIPHNNMLSIYEINNAESSSSVTGPSDSGRSGVSSIDGSEDYSPGIFNPLSVKFQMEFLKVPESPKTLNRESYPGTDIHMAEASSAPRSLTGTEGSSASKIFDPNIVYPSIDLKRPDSETITKVNPEDKSIQGPIFVENEETRPSAEDKSFSCNVKTELPNISMQSSVDSFTNVSEFDSLKKSIDDTESSDVNKTPSDLSFGTPNVQNSLSDMSSTLTDDCPKQSQNETSVKVWTLWKNVHCKAENTTPKSAPSLRRHNTWESSKFSYAFSLPNQVSIDTASDRSVAGSDRVEDIDDAEVLLFQSTAVRRDSDSTYSEPDLGVIDNLSQSSISSAGNHSDGKDRTFFNVSPNIRGEHRLVSDNCLKSSPTTINEVTNCLCTASTAIWQGTFNTENGLFRSESPLENAALSNISHHCISMKDRVEDFAIKSENVKEHSDKRGYLVQLSRNLPDDYGDNSSGDECDKEIGRINIRPHVRRGHESMPKRLEDKHSNKQSNLTKQMGMHAVNNNRLEYQSHSGMNVVADLARKSQTKNETLLHKFQAAQLSSLLNQKPIPMSHPLPHINIKDTSTSKLNVAKTSETDESDQSNAIVLSVEFDIDQPEFMHPQSEKIESTFSQDVPNTLINELEVMALFKSMQEMDSCSVDTNSPRGFKLSQITEEETQSEESPTFDSRNRFNFAMFQSQPTNDTLVEMSPTNGSDVMAEFTNLSDQSRNFESESGNNSSLQHIKHNIQKVRLDKTLHVRAEDDINTHITGDSSQQVNSSRIGSPSLPYKTSQNDVSTDDFLSSYKAEDTNTNIDVRLDTCRPCFNDCTNSATSPAVLETVTVTTQRNKGDALRSTSHSSAQVTQRTFLNFNISGSRTRPPTSNLVTEQPVAHVSTLNIQIGDYRNKDESPSISPASSLENAKSNYSRMSPISSLRSEDMMSIDAKLTDAVKRFTNKDNLDLMERRKRATVTTMFSQGSEDEVQMHASAVGDTSKSRVRRHRENLERKSVGKSTQRSDSKGTSIRSREYLQLLHRQEQVYSSGESASDSDLTTALHVDSDVDLRERDLAMGRLAGDYMDDDDDATKEDDRQMPPLKDNAITTVDTNNKNVLPLVRIATSLVKPEDQWKTESLTSDSATVLTKRTNETPRVIVHQPSDDYQAHECNMRGLVSVDPQKSAEANDNHLHTKREEPKKNKFIHGPPVSHWSVPKDKEKAGRIWTRRLQRTQFLSPVSAVTINNSSEMSASSYRQTNSTDDSHPELDYLDIISKLNGSHEKQKNALLSLPDQRQTKSLMSPPPCIKITKDNTESYSDPNGPKSLGNNMNSKGEHTRCLIDYDICNAAVPEIVDNDIHDVKKHNTDSSRFLDDTTKYNVMSQNVNSPEIKSVGEPLTLAISKDKLLADPTHIIDTSDSTEESPILDPISEGMVDEGVDQALQRNLKRQNPLIERFDKLYVKSSSVTSKDSGFESNGK